MCEVARVVCGIVAGREVAKIAQKASVWCMCGVEVESNLCVIKFSTGQKTG